MAKKRKTRQEKIILRLKRELATKQTSIAPRTAQSKPRQEAILNEARTKLPIQNLEKRVNNTVLSYDSKLIKKDLIKTVVLALLAFSFELMLYLRLR